jgi:hypothetical protein
MSETIKNQLVQVNGKILILEQEIQSKRILLRSWVVMDSNYYSNWRDKQSNQNRIVVIRKQIEQYEEELLPLKKRKADIMALIEQENILIEKQEEKEMSEINSTSFLDLSD